MTSRDDDMTSRRDDVIRVKKAGIMDASVDVLRSKDTIYSKFNVLKVERHCRGDGIQFYTVYSKFHSCHQ